MSAILNEDRKVDLLAFDDEFDSKGDVAHIEDNVEVTESATLSPPVLSHFAYTPQAPFIRKFWRLFVIGLCVNLCAMYTGYTLSAPGSIIANEGEWEPLHRSRCGSVLTCECDQVSSSSLRPRLIRPLASRLSTPPSLGYGVP